MNQPLKVLQVAAADVTVKKLLLPLIDRLAADGYRVHIACSQGHYMTELQDRGYTVHRVDIERRINPVSNLRSLWRLYCLIKKENFDIVHVHTPVAAVLGRVAAWVARSPVVIYTAHGFYFHEHMPATTRRLVVWLESLLSTMTDVVFTQSHEDAIAAVAEHIYPENKVIWIGNGVDVGHFLARPDSNGTRANLALSERDKVAGFVGRLVEEKGILDLIEAMKLVIKAIPEARLLVVGDTLDSDRDRKIKLAFTRVLKQDNLASYIRFTGFVEDASKVMGAMDVFVLPSHREGMPRTVIEAMISGRPVIATNIRGCREEVVQGVTGLLVPISDPPALAAAITALLSNPDLARKMGAEGRRRACELFDERTVLNRQIKAYSEIVRQRLADESSRRQKNGRKAASTMV